MTFIVAWALFFCFRHDKETISGEVVSKTVTLAQSGTTLTAEPKDGKTDYNYGETITITGTVGASGEAPMTASLNSLTPPSAGQVAVYDKDGKQVSEPGMMLRAKYTLTVDTKTLGAGEHTLTVKYIESTVMAQATLTVNVTVAECPHTRSPRRTKTSLSLTNTPPVWYGIFFAGRSTGPAPSGSRMN